MWGVMVCGWGGGFVARGGKNVSGVGVVAREGAAVMVEVDRS